MRMAGKGLWWCWIVANVAVLAECTLFCQEGVEIVDDTKIKVTSVGRLLEETDGNLGNDIAGCMEKVLEELGQAGLKGEDEIHKAGKQRNEALYLVTENMGEVGKKSKRLWRKSVKKGDEYIRVLVDSYATASLTEVREKARLIVAAFKKFELSFHTTDRVREMVGVYPAEGVQDADGISVALGVYVSRCEICLGALDVEKEWIEFEKRKASGWESMGEESKVMFNSVRKQSSDKIVREMMDDVRTTKLRPFIGSMLMWKHGNLEATYTYEESADMEIYGPLANYFYYIIHTLFNAVLDVHCKDDDVLDVAAKFHRFRVTHVLREE